MYLNNKMITASIQYIYRVIIISIIILVGFWLVSNPIGVHAQAYGGAIATRQFIANKNVKSGDIISFDKNTQTYHLAHIPGDKDVFGVAVKSPALLLSEGDLGIPIITSGEVSVNVTTKNGLIKVGDYISASSIPGKGVKAISSDPYIIGTAISALHVASSSSTSSTSKVQYGSVRVSLRHTLNPLVAGVQQIPQSVAIGKNIIFHIVKYILAALIAVGTVYIAFRASGSSMRSGIISIGRNPLAKSSIHSMLVLNMIIIILISVIGLVAALALVFLPI